MFEELKPHIADLRKRLTISIITIIVMFFVVFSFWQPLLDIMTKPLIEVLPEGSKMIFTAVPEQFFTAVKVSFFASFLISLPVVFWQFWIFVAPGLYEHEKKLVIPFVLFATIMFLSGAFFAYYVVIPIGFEFLINFSGGMFTAMPSIGEYVGFFTKLLVAFGISFEMPVITFFLAKIGLVTDKTLTDFFRYAVVIIFILAALLTPPDMITQFLMAIPMILLYGMSILIAKSINPHVVEHEPMTEEEKAQAASKE